MSRWIVVAVILCACKSKPESKPDPAAKTAVATPAAKPPATTVEKHAAKAPPTPAQIAGKILVFKTVPYPAAVPGLNPPYAFRTSILAQYAYTDYLYETPGDWYTKYVPVPASVSSSYHSRFVWSQLGGFSNIGMNKGSAPAAGMVVVYDYSPAAAFGLIQRTVYSLTGNGGPGTVYVNVPTLCLDRVNGVKVLADAQAGKTATLTLNASFQNATSQYVIGWLPGKDYGTARDEQILIATHTDAMSLVEEDGALGMLGIMHYMNHIPQSSRPKTLIFWFDTRHFMPGAEGAWSQYDYYLENPSLLKPIKFTLAMEHMGGRSTIETGPGGNDYDYAPGGPNSGALITSFIDIFNNNLWLVDTVKHAAEDNHWPRVAASDGGIAPGVNGGYMKTVNSPLNKGRSYTPNIPGIGLAGDWPGAWTQTYSQVDTEAGPNGFDKDYFVQQVAGLTQLAGEFMLVHPRVIDLGWGTLKSALVNLPDSGFVARPAAAHRAALLKQYVAAFRQVETAALDQAGSTLHDLAEHIAVAITTGRRDALTALVDAQLARLKS